MAKISLNELFNKLDVNGDGELTMDEVISGAALLNMTEDEAAKAFDDLDEDGSGKLTRSEFDAAQAMMEEYERLMKETADLEQEAADADAQLKAETEKAAMAANEAKRKPPKPRLTVDELFKLVDTNGDGELTREEIKAAAAVGPFGKLGMNEEEALELFDQLDADGSGTLTQSEFAQAEAMMLEYEKLMLEAEELEAEAADAEADALAEQKRAEKAAESAKVAEEKKRAAARKKRETDALREEKKVAQNITKQKKADAKAAPFKVAFDVTLSDLTVSV